ncbi:hypothetical protein L9F63_020333, partial [Diploptera punctata]
GHELHKYLQEQGYNDYEVASTKDVRSNIGLQHICQKAFNTVTSSLRNILTGNKISNRKVYATSLHSDIEIILNSGLLLEEDYECILCFLEPINVAEDKYLWNNVALLCGIGMCVMLRAWRNFLTTWSMPAAYTLLAGGHLVNTWCIHQQKKKFSATLLSLLHVLKEISVQRRKTILFIQENELLLRGFTLAKCKTAVLDDLNTLKSNWFLMTGLREGISRVMQDFNCIMKRATKDLVRDFPLKGQLDNEHNYAAFLIAEDLGNNTDDVNKYSLGCLKRLQNANILLQSEFLRRCALCCMTSLWSDDLQSLAPLHETANTMLTTLHMFMEFLAVDYKFYSCYGRGERNTNQQLVPSTSHMSNVYLGVHSARLYLQGMLHQITQLEEMLQDISDNIQPDNLSCIFIELSYVSQEMTSCMNSIEIALSYCKSSEDSLEPIAEMNPPVLSQENVNVHKSDPIPVGYSDFDPPVEDEVFVALIRGTIEDDDFDEDPFNFTVEKEEKQQKECSKRMLTELKTVLVHKAEEMKQREDRALRNKGMLISDYSSGCEADASEDDTLKSETIDSLKSETIDSLKSEILDSSSTVEIESFSRTLLSDQNFSMAGIPLKPLPQTLVGDEETFGDSIESDTDEMEDS